MVSYLLWVDSMSSPGSSVGKEMQKHQNQREGSVTKTPPPTPGFREGVRIKEWGAARSWKMQVNWLSLEPLEWRQPGQPHDCGPVRPTLDLTTNSACCFKGLAWATCYNSLGELQYLLWNLRENPGPLCSLSFSPHGMLWSRDSDTSNQNPDPPPTPFPGPCFPTGLRECRTPSASPWEVCSLEHLLLKGYLFSGPSHSCLH